MTAVPIRRLQTDILILGSGGAGLFAALHAKARAPGLKVTVAVKGLLGKCGCTRMVQGGYNVALAAGDSVERHFMDTITGSAWLADQDLAWTLVSTAVERIALIAAGILVLTPVAMNDTIGIGLLVAVMAIQFFRARA